MIKAAPAWLIPNHAIANPISASGGHRSERPDERAVTSSRRPLHEKATPAATPSPVPTTVPGIQWRMLDHSAVVIVPEANSSANASPTATGDGNTYAACVSDIRCHTTTTNPTTPASPRREPPGIVEAEAAAQFVPVELPSGVGGHQSESYTSKSKIASFDSCSSICPLFAANSEKTGVASVISRGQ